MLNLTIYYVQSITFNQKLFQIIETAISVHTHTYTLNLGVHVQYVDNDKQFSIIHHCIQIEIECFMSMKFQMECIYFVKFEYMRWIECIQKGFYAIAVGNSGGRMWKCVIIVHIVALAMKNAIFQFPICYQFIHKSIYFSFTSLIQSNPIFFRLFNGK